MAKMWPNLAAISELQSQRGDPEPVIQRTSSQDTRHRWPNLAAISDLVQKEGEAKYAVLAATVLREDDGEEKEEEEAAEEQENALQRSPLHSISGARYKLGSMLRAETFKVRADAAIQRGHRNSITDMEGVGSTSKWNMLRQMKGSLGAHPPDSILPQNLNRGPPPPSHLKMHRHSLADPGGGAASMRRHGLMKFKQHSMANLVSFALDAEDFSGKGWMEDAAGDKRLAWKKNKGFNNATIDVAASLQADEPDSLQQNIYRVRKLSMTEGHVDVTSAPESRAKRRWKTSVWNHIHPLSALRLTAEKRLLTVIARLYKAKSRDKAEILGEIGEIKMIKGHPQAAKALIKMLKDKEWRTRLKALQLIPRLVIKGDSGAIEAVVDRLLDWNLEVRRAAVATLRDSPAMLHCDLLSAKDLKELGEEFEEGHVWCSVRLSSSADEGHYQTQKEQYSRRPHWNHHYFLKVLDPDEAVVIIDVIASAAPDPKIEHQQVREVKLASVTVRVPEIYDELVHAAKWFPLVDDNKEPAGALSIKWRFELGAGIGLKSEMTEIIRFVEPALLDEDFWTRKEALHLFTDYYGPGSLEATRVLTRGIHDLVGDVRWTAVECLRHVLSNLDRNCCLMVLEQTVPMVRYESVAEIRAAAIEVAYLAGKGVPEWQDPADGKCLKDLMEERLEDDNWMVRRIGVLAFAEMSELYDRDAIVALLPFLGDEVFYVRVNAAKGLARLTPQLLKQNQEPTDEDIELIKVIVEGYKDFPERHGQMENAGLETGDEIGTRFGLLFKMGVPAQAGWDAKEHATWKHVREWTDGRWESVMASRDAKDKRVSGEKALLKNKWVQVGIRLYGLNPKYKGQITEDLQRAIEWAREHAACLIQSMMRGVWGREEAKLRKAVVMQAKAQTQAKDKKESSLSPVQLLQLRMKMQQRKAMEQPSVRNVFTQVNAQPSEQDDFLRFMLPTPQADVRVRTKGRKESTTSGSGGGTPQGVSLPTTPGRESVGRQAAFQARKARGGRSPLQPEASERLVADSGAPGLARVTGQHNAPLPQASAPRTLAVRAVQYAHQLSSRNLDQIRPNSGQGSRLDAVQASSQPKGGKAAGAEEGVGGGGLGQRAHHAAHTLQAREQEREAQEQQKLLARPRQGTMKDILPAHPTKEDSAVTKATKKALGMEDKPVSRLPARRGDQDSPAHRHGHNKTPKKLGSGWMADMQKETKRVASK